MQNYTRPGYAGTTTNLQIVLNTQKNPYLNQATQKNTCQIFLAKKIPESKISNPKISFDYPRHLKSGVPPPPPPPGGSEANKKHIKNLSNKLRITNDENNLLAKGLKFIPTPVTKEIHIKRQLLRDFEQFTRRMRLRYIYRGEEKEPQPYHVKSTWNPPLQPSVALETYLEEVKVQLAATKLTKPKNNLQSAERKALVALKRNHEINLKKADKGTTTVIYLFIYLPFKK